ncbi:MAG: YebC/PmpR family DNA-binding transcriptional regulator [Acetobacteraceae bacterium]
MAGHSQFKNIMHRKGAQDARRAREFGRLIREITLSARQGLPETVANPRLRAAVAAAREANMPKDTIERAIRKATGADAEAEFSEVRYEGYGPAGVAVIVEALTDNRNRTASDVRSAFTRNGGALGDTNSVAFLFHRQGVVRYPPAAANADTMLEAAIEAGAENVDSTPEGHQVTSAVTDFFAVRDAMETRFGPPERAELEWKPQSVVTLDAEQASSVLKLFDQLDEIDDVQNVSANCDIPESVLSQIDA